MPHTHHNQNHQNHQNRQNNPAKHHPRILVAGSNPTLAHGLEGGLKARGYEDVRSTTDAREIVPLFDKWQFTVLFLDMSMHNVPGPLVLAHFSKAIAEKKLVIVAQTDAGNFIMAERALVLGALDVCAVDVSSSEAQARVRTAIHWMERGNGSPDNVIDFYTARDARNARPG